ncbi:LD-carboxypeptidase [Candidatus Sodalis endolongispinus]|uniref:LD-carboxypeptidase n=1 Tax=Candidatus Sodalis endolongispinus TaxID=2812662 RepID=A0ABS5YBW4_9GAMM|nr:LD-carboxypeptidase [Candidatus Sodalis endolongispinus]MBT9432504.1 LD-carboxypeptidase [Candidatus Sodalis endolongispinus]
MAKTIHLISSSSEYLEQSIPDIVTALKRQGFQVNMQYLDQQVSDFGYVNSDRARGENLVKALTDDNVDYLWFVRGGSGALNLLPHLFANLTHIHGAREKILIGFSDVTAIHDFINKHVGWRSVHGIVASSNKDMYQLQGSNGLNKNTGFRQTLDAITQGVNYPGLLPLNAPAKVGAAGVLMGGNLTLLQSLFSTRYEKYLRDEILLLEDTGVTYKQLDRALHQLQYKKDFTPNAIVFGQFFTLEATDEERLIFKSVILDFAETTSIPVYYYPYFGHGVTNNPLLLKQQVTITCHPEQEYCTLRQAGIRHESKRGQQKRTHAGE